uniref:Oligopeptide transporter n=1 Tax=Tanacetum cinerariifolium TaxID=118510 RepID=A0A6L2JV27_TANCI|nr:oligopeptide transporter [Tanacetum cinerariifolium]
MVKPEIGNDDNFKIKIQFMKKLRRNLFAGIEDEDAHEHEQVANDEWIKKFRENTDLNLKKLDAVTKNLEVKIENLTQAVLRNEGNTTEKVKNTMDKAREVKKEPVPRDLPIVNPYVPPVPFPRRLEEQKDDPYITRESVCTIGFSKRTHEEELKLLIAENTQEVKKEPVPRDLPIVNPYVPPVPFPRRLEEQKDDPYITRESVCTIGFSKRTHEEELKLLIAENTQSSLTEMKAHSCIDNTSRVWKFKITLACGYVERIFAD